MTSLRKSEGVSLSYVEKVLEVHMSLIWKSRSQGICIKETYSGMEIF